jgi:hypothetical protein
MARAPSSVTWRGCVFDTSLIEHTDRHPSQALVVVIMIISPLALTRNDG